MKNFFKDFQCKKGDFFIFVFIVAIIVTTSVFFYRQPGEAKIVKIYVDGEEYGAYTFSQRYETIFDVPAKGGYRTGYNRIRIKDETVTVIDSSCPNKDCVYMGSIRDAGDMLICLPYKIVIRLEGGEAIDAVSY